MHPSLSALPLSHTVSITVESLKVQSSVNIAEVYPEFLAKPNLEACPHQTMEDYALEIIQRGYICHSTSLASAEFFFVEKKGGRLCPCNDCQGLK